MIKVMFVICVLAIAGPAAADDEIVRGQVVKVEASEIYINLGKDRAVTDGAPLRLKRPIKLQHPVTRAQIEDWVPIGSAVVTQAGGQLSRAIVGTLIDEVKVGDLVEVLIDRPDQPGPAPVPQPTPQGPPVDPATLEVIAAFATQSGQTIDARIATWEGFLSKHPQSPYATSIKKDVEVLTTLREQMRPRTLAEANELVVRAEHVPATKVRAGRALAVVFVLERPGDVAAAYLHYRVANAKTFRRVLLARENDIYLRGSLPAEVVRAPGVEYFVEASGPTGTSGLAIGSPAQPLHVDVIAPSPIPDRFGPAPGRSSVHITGEYLDFATLEHRNGDRRDRVVEANVDFTYRIDRIVQSVGVGYGVFAGQGGFANREYGPTDPVPESAFQFGYADLELALSGESKVHVSAGGKLIAGVGRDGFGLGAEGRLRIGRRDSANLMFVGRTLEQVGFLADIVFGARPSSDLGFAVSVGATDQPNNGDVGVKLGTELEYFAGEHVSLLLRGSWQGRNTQHGGIGGGAGVGFTW